MGLNSPNRQQHQISIPSASHAQRQPAISLNLPLRDLLVGSREDYNEICVPLYNAALSGDRKAVEAILNNRPEVVCYCITESYETVLHIAVLGKSYSVLKYLLGLMEKKDLALQNANGETALCLAATEGVVKIAKLLVESNNALLDIPTSQGKLPLYMAAFFGNQDMVEYLFSVQNINGDVWTHESRGSFFLKCIEADQFGIALQIVEDHPELATEMKPIRVLARKSKAFNILKKPLFPEFPQSAYRDFKLILKNKPPSQQEFQSQTAQKLLRIIWKNIMKLPKAKVDEIIRGPADPLLQNGVQTPKYSSHVLFIAAEMGNTAFVADLIGRYPDIACEVNYNNRTIFHIAVLNRHAGIYMLLHEIGTLKNSIITLEDEKGNNMLHLVGMLEEQGKHTRHDQEMRGVALQMQRELLWFEEVKATLPPSFQERKNAYGLTPRELFTEEHRHIISKDKDWLKGTIEQTMVVGALTASVTFAATITFAGGYNQDTGSPMFRSKNYFTLFLILIAISFSYSCLSILIGLSILISNFTEQDFMHIIPKKLTFAILSVFSSVTSMLSAIVVNVFLLYEPKSYAIPLAAMVFMSLPIFFLHTDVFPIVFYLFNSLLNVRSTFDHKKKILYYPNTWI